MTLIHTPQPNDDGTIGVRVSEPLQNGEGEKVVNRYVLTPGAFDAEGDWAAADVSAEPQNVQDAAAAYWTVQRVNEWKAAHPWVPLSPPSPQDVWAEQKRRLALGFDYDFGDERGVHRIGTTEADMQGWSEVTTIAQALLNVGQSTQPITIATNTGAVEITPVEWQLILLAAGQFRQPIFQASFALAALDPIPADFADDSYWA